MMPTSSSSPSPIFSSSSTAEPYPLPSSLHFSNILNSQTNVNADSPTNSTVPPSSSLPISSFQLPESLGLIPTDDLTFLSEDDEDDEDGKIENQRRKLLRSSSSSPPPSPPSSSYVSCRLNREERKLLWVNRLSYIWAKMTSAFWISFSLFLIYYTNIFKVIWRCRHSADNFSSFCFIFGMGIFGCTFSLLFFLSIILPIRGVSVKTAKRKYPLAIPLLSCGGLLSFFILCLAFWRLWGGGTIFILGILFFGFVSSSEFLPGGIVGGAMMIAVAIGATLSPYVINHEGLAHRKEACVE